MTKRLGLVLAPFGGAGQKEMIETIKIAEANGYDSVWVAEAWGTDAFTQLGAIAAQTSTIKLGTGIVNIYSRSAAVLAMTSVTLDQISNGRFMLGIGTSGNRVIEGLHGIPFEKPITRLREYVEIIKTLVAGKKLKYKGKIHDLPRGFQLQTTGPRKEIPIYIASLAQKSITQIGELADGWIPTYWPMDQFGVGNAWLAEGAAKTDRDVSKIDTAPFVTLAVNKDKNAARNMARMPLGFYIGGMGDFYYNMLCRFGYEKECEAVKTAWKEKRRGEAMQLITDEMIDTIAITGPIEECREKLYELYNKGVTLPLIPMANMGGMKTTREMIEGLAPK